jgi:hypothetical protein
MLKAKDILNKLSEMSGPDSEVADIDYANNDYDYYPELTSRVYNGQDDIASLDAKTAIGYDDEIEDDDVFDGEYDDEISGDDEVDYDDTSGDEDDYSDYDFDYNDDSDTTYDDFPPEDVSLSVLPDEGEGY